LIDKEKLLKDVDIALTRVLHQAGMERHEISRELALFWMLVSMDQTRDTLEPLVENGNIFLYRNLSGGYQFGAQFTGTGAAVFLSPVEPDTTSDEALEELEELRELLQAGFVSDKALFPSPSIPTTTAASGEKP
jgi:hypothetical protein